MNLNCHYGCDAPIEGGGGRVRQMFEQRRQTGGGLDRSVCSTNCYVINCSTITIIQIIIIIIIIISHHFKCYVVRLAPTSSLTLSAH